VIFLPISILILNSKFLDCGHVKENMENGLARMVAEKDSTESDLEVVKQSYKPRKNLQ